MTYQNEGGKKICPFEIKEKNVTVDNIFLLCVKQEYFLLHYFKTTTLISCGKSYISLTQNNATTFCYDVKEII